MPPTLDEDHIAPLVHQLGRQHQPRRTRTDDTHVGVERGAIDEALCVELHAPPLPVRARVTETDPAVTIIIPTLGLRERAASLQAAIESALAQDGVCPTVIVVLNGRAVTPTSSARSGKIVA